MGRRIVYRPDKKVKIVSGLFAGETGKLDEVSRDKKHFKLVGRKSWYPASMLRLVK